MFCINPGDENVVTYLRYIAEVECMLHDVGLSVSRADDHCLMERPSSDVWNQVYPSRGLPRQSHPRHANIP